MKKDDIQKIISLGEPNVFTIDPDIKTEISGRKINTLVSDMRRHLAKHKKVHIILVKE
jgi:hypothetical protein